MGVDSFLGENWPFFDLLFDPCDPYVTFDAIFVCVWVVVNVMVTLTKFGQNSDIGKYVKMACCQKKEERRNTSEYKTLPVSGRGKEEIVRKK